MFISVTRVRSQSSRAPSAGDPSCRGENDDTARRIDSGDESARAISAWAGAKPGNSARKSINRNATVMRFTA